MLKKSKLNTKIWKPLALFAAGGLILFLISSIIIPSFFEGVDNRYTDLMFHLRRDLLGPEEVSPNIVQVAFMDKDWKDQNRSIDDETLGNLIDELVALGVNCIGLDILFPGNFSGPGWKKGHFLNSIRKSIESNIPVYVPARINEIKQDIKYPYVSASEMVVSSTLLTDLGCKIGHINLPIKDDQGIRRKVPLYIGHNDTGIFSLSLSLVGAYWNCSEDRIKPVGNSIILEGVPSRIWKDKDITIPVDEAGFMNINVPADYNTSVLHYSFSDILDAKTEDPRIPFIDLEINFENSIVIISDIRSNSKDFGKGILDETYPLSFDHSNIINTILTENFLYNRSPIDIVLTTLLLLILPFLFLNRFSSRKAGLLTAVLLLIFISYQAIGFLFFNILPGVGVPLLGYLFSLITGFIYSQKQRRILLQNHLNQSQVELDTLRTLKSAQPVLPKTGPDPEKGKKPSPEEKSSISGGKTKKTKSPKPKPLEHPEVFRHIVGTSVEMNHLFARVEEVAESFMPILITGETGVGKNQIPGVIHTLSGRQGKLVTVNIAGLDDMMFSDTLFGHTKGAYTGAHGVRAGLIEEAQGGTLFLDEIGDLEPASQVKLLDLIQNGKFYPLGSDKEQISDARIVAATNARLKNKIKDGSFREDLFYRLTYHLKIPALRDRFEDLPYLVSCFFEQAAKDLEKKKPTVPAELVTLLKSYHFPGNIRELQKMVFESLSRHKSKVLSLAFFKEYIFSHGKGEDLAVKNKDDNSLVLNYSGTFPSIKDATSILVDEAMKKAEGSQVVAAGMLGISPSALNKRLKSKDKKEKG